MSVIYLQDYNLWESIGELAYRYGIALWVTSRIIAWRMDIKTCCGGEQATPAQQASQMPMQGPI